MGYDAEAADFIASLHDGNEGFGALLLRDAAADADNHALPPILQFFPSPERAVNLLLRLVANAAGIKKNQIRRLNVFGALIVHTTQNLRDALRIVLVHLATVGLQI